RRVAFGRGVTAPLRIGRGDNHKRTLRNEADRCFVKVGKLVFHRHILGRAKTFTEVLGSAWSCEGYTHRCRLSVGVYRGLLLLCKDFERVLFEGCSSSAVMPQILVFQLSVRFCCAINIAV